ncbi:synaptonemal complex protein 2-like isoform X2 [Rhinatrema bivittatum]|uniref:synaptonemal complex protein 2-like isoform X2 n=1 Tax=Rhinatrema bivittatum TaxID=194408 RepID=UPI00112835F3|nr:synaptonemal complex protein 2-like isoform X2 [Rhinatrema bivittatum]
MSEEENQQPSSEISKIMAPSKELYLESLLIDAFKGKGFQKINELLQEKGVWTSQKYSKLQLNQLDRLVNKELDKNEFGNVSLLMKCIQQFCASHLDEEAALIQQGLVPKMVLWFERATEFLSVKGLQLDTTLMSLIEDFYDTALVICKCSTSEGKQQLLDMFLLRLGLLVMQKNAAFILRLEALRTINSILDGVPREDRKRFHLSEELCVLAQDLAKTILEAGALIYVDVLVCSLPSADYDIQVAISEALCRMMTKKWRESLVDRWFTDNYFAEAFKEIKDKEFETDCRKFLNDLNSRLGDKRSVYTFPCITAFADMDEVAKPADDKLEKFWIDFNVGSNSVSFYINNKEGPLWDSVRLGKEIINSYSLQETDDQKIFIICLVKPISILNRETTKVKIYFEDQFNVLPVIKRILGEERMTKTDDKGLPTMGLTELEGNTLITRDSTYAEWKKVQRCEQAESLSDILSSQLSDQSAALKMSSGTTSTQKSLSESQTAQTESIQKPTTILPSAQEPVSKVSGPVTLDEVIEIPVEESSDIQEVQNYFSEGTEQEKKNKKTNPSKQMEAKRNKSSRKKRTASAPEMRQYSGYRKHLFSDTNSGTGSNSQSEKSWILEYQKRPLSEKAKSADYTRRLPRIRSKLKILPLSSESSPEEYKKKDAVSVSRFMSVIQPKVSKANTKKLSVPGQKLPGVSAFLTPGDSYIKNTDEVHPSDDLETDSLHALDGASSPEYSEAFESIKKKLSFQRSQSSRRNHVSGAKRRNSDLSTGSLLKKMKLSRSEPSVEPTLEIPIKPRKLFDSSERENKRRTELSSAAEVISEDLDDVFYGEDQEEELSDSSVIAVFEQFSNDLKKKFWSRYKKMEFRTQNALKSSEQHISTLLNRIHQCRLQKLDNFHKIVVHELKSLENEAQVLIDLEKETVDFWTKQSIKLNSFCDLQKQRLKTMDSVVEENVGTFENSVQQIVKDEQALERTEENFKAVVTSNEAA